MALLTAIGLALIFSSPAEPHYPKKPEPYRAMTAIEKHEYLHHAQRTVRREMRQARTYRQLVWHRRALKRVNRRLAMMHRQRRPTLSYWINRQIYAATVIGRESGGDPWPNCPDPFDGGGYTWTDTVRCENGGNWLDSPGYYRCGLQFDPAWERRFGKLCP